MEKIRIWVGLDYHQKRTQVCVVDEGGAVLCNRSVPSTIEEITRAVGPHGAPASVAIESCSGAAQLAHELIEQAGLPARLTHPGYVNRMRHNPDKSDLSDARLLAELARSGFLPEVWLAPEPIRDLRCLTQRRVQLVQQRRQTKVRVLALLRERRVAEPPLGRWTRAWMAWLGGADLNQTVRWIINDLLGDLARLGEQIKAVEARLAEQTAGDRVVERLRAIRGIGPVTAWMLRADIGRFDRFRTGKQLSRYCGLSPRNASSGERVADAGLVKAGRGALRAVLVQSAHRLCRYDERWRRLFESMRERGKPASVAVAAVANRWVRWLFHRMNEQTAAA
jgi:transposase